MNINILKESTVEVVKKSMSDKDVIYSARVSTVGANHEVETEDDDYKLINFLMRGRHGSPFEHNSITFYIKAPIFVWREFMRHRIGISYNEESGRYKQLDADFYVPPVGRPLVQEGKPGHYTFFPGSEDQHRCAVDNLVESYILAYRNYEYMMDQGIAKEVARMCLPVGIFSSAYVTMNARSIMNFLSLRTKHEGSTFPSFPQYEINMVANKIEQIWSELMPITAKSFRENGSVAP